MKRSFVVGTVDRVMWAMCIAAYVLITDYFSPLSVVQADLNEGSIVEEHPLGTTAAEDRFIIIVATLAMYAALDPDGYKTVCPDQMPKTLMNMIAQVLRDRGEMVSHDAVLGERNRLLETAAEILRKNHIYHLHLAAALMKGTVTTGVIENLKEKYCNDLRHVA